MYKLQHLHRWFWDRHVHRASQEACGESVCTIACTCIATLGITHTTHFTEVLVKAFQSVLLNSWFSWPANSTNHIKQQGLLSVIPFNAHLRVIWTPLIVFSLSTASLLLTVSLHRTSTECVHCPKSLCVVAELYYIGIYLSAAVADNRKTAPMGLDKGWFVDRRTRTPPVMKLYK